MSDNRMPDSYGEDILQCQISHLDEEIIALQLYIEKLEKFLDTLARNTSDINFKMQVENLLRDNPYE